MPASRTGQKRVPCSRNEARTHQLIALELLLAAQTGHGFTVGIAGDTAWRLDGWFHTFLEAGQSGAGCSENSASSVARTRCGRERDHAGVILEKQPLSLPDRTSRAAMGVARTAV